MVWYGIGIICIISYSIIMWLRLSSFYFYLYGRNSLLLVSPLLCISDVMWLVRTDHLWICSASLLYEWSTLYCLQVYFWFWFYLLFLTKKLSMVFYACWQYLLVNWFFFLHQLFYSLLSTLPEVWHFISECEGRLWFHWNED